jgi:RHS repeat-associated protein
VTGDATGKETAKFSDDAFGRVTAITGGTRPAVLTWAGDTTLAKLVDGLGPDAVTTTMSTYGGRIVGKQVTGQSGSEEVHYGYGSGIDGSPAVIYSARDGVTGAPQSYSFALPGAVNVVVPVDGVATMTFNGVDGSALATIAAPFLNLAGASGGQPGAPLGPSPRFGPYGEPLEAPRAKSSPAMPDYSWQGAGQLETLGGPSSITLAGARPYLPGTGTFLAPDPRLDAADNLYSYTPGDPINGSDGTGEANGWSWFFEIVGAALVAASFVVGAVSGGFLIPMALGMAAAGLSMVSMKMQTEPSPALDTFRTVMFWGEIAATVVTIGASLAMLSKWGANNGVVKLLAGAGRSLASNTTDNAARSTARASITSLSSGLAESATKQVVQAGKWSRFVDWVRLANPANPEWATMGGTRGYLKSLGKLSGKWGSVVGAYKFQTWATEWVPDSWKEAMQAQAAPASG